MTTDLALPLPGTKRDDDDAVCDQLFGEVLPRHVHLLGAGGAGVSGVARILHARGVRISGHDRADSQLFQELESLNIELELGEPEATSLPADVDLVIRSAAISLDDPRLVAARERGVTLLKYGEALARMAPEMRTLAVAGTHGKTTTGWMLWHALDGIGDEFGGPVPGALIGGLCRRLETNALAGARGGWFCVEACEYDRTFLNLRPGGAIITNVEGDHLDYYGTLSELHGAFARFTDRLHPDGLLVVGSEVPENVEHAWSGDVWRLGRELFVDLLGEVRGCFRFRLRGPGWASPPIQLRVPGHFNVENAALALGLAVGMMQRTEGFDPGRLAAAAAVGLERFQGAARRFELWGTVGEVDLVHDYAHHPTEVRVTLEAARRAYPGKLLCVLFQPHQHSRTARFLEEFAEGLRSADRVVVSDVYGARNHIDGERFAGSTELVLALRQRGVNAVEGGGLGASARIFLERLPRHAAALVLGAGDVESLRDELLQALALRGTPTGQSR